MRRQSTDEGEGGLDSLLDTMTNVVGILVIVLVVTQLGVGDAIQRIADKMNIDPQQLAEAEQRLEAARKERDMLLAAMDKEDPAENLAEDYDQRLQELQLQIDNEQKKLDDLESLRQANEEQLSAKELALADAKKREEELEKIREKVEQLNREWTANDERMQQLQAMLAETPEQMAPPPKEITLPNPRPAPEGIEQLIVVCANNKVYPLPAPPAIEQIRQAAQLKVPPTFTRVRRSFNPLTGEGAELFVKEFNERPLRDPDNYFEILLYDSGGTPRLRFVPRETGGEDERAVKGSRSKFQLALNQINPNAYFIRFYVCTDSFDIYVTARRIVSDKNLLAGWEPQNAGWTYTTHLGGEFRLGPKPPPKPPGPAPPGPPKPVRPPNVID
jgi:hypothetical protein